jgi:mevalonate kinase
MANRVTASAPGKLMLFGEHAVVYGYPCIVTAVDKRMRVSVNFNGKGEIVVRAPQVGLDIYHKNIGMLGRQEVPKPVRFIERLVKSFYDRYRVNSGLEIVTKCDFHAKYGFGSSAAVTVALALALGEIYSIKVSKRELFELCYKTVIDVQGVGSGFDIAAAIYGGTLYFVSGGKKIVNLKVSHLPFIVGYTGVKADTPTLVRQVAELRSISRKEVDSIFSKIDVVSNKAKGALVREDVVELGSLMDRNQNLLKKLGVSSIQLDNLIKAAREAGALGAKLSGAGGGDCMIALRQAQGKQLSRNKSKSKEIERAIEKAGGEVIDVGINAEGVRIES